MRGFLVVSFGVAGGSAALPNDTALVGGRMADPETVANRASEEHADTLVVGVRTGLMNGGFVVRSGDLILDATHVQPIRSEIE